VVVTRLADGAVLERRGVIPDIEVVFDRTSLLQGIEAAINYLEQK
jgi:hypothetical protein